MIHQQAFPLARKQRIEASHSKQEPQPEKSAMKLLPVTTTNLSLLSNVALLHNGISWDPLQREQQHSFPFGGPPTLISPFFSFAKPLRSLSSAAMAPRTTAREPTSTGDIVRIGIVGGGICGNSVAHALAKKLAVGGSNAREYRIVVLEGDPHSPVSETPIPCTSTSTCTSAAQERQMEAPKWHAAAARNANSIVPGSSMHVFSKKSAVWQIAHDTIEEWFSLAQEWLQSKLTQSRHYDLTLRLAPREDFAVTPPYFALHPWKCIGPSATSHERWTFIRFVKHFLYYSIVKGDVDASDRGNCMCQLAKANRELFLEIVQEMNKKGHNIQYSRGFLALYRDLEAAKQSQATTQRHGEEAHLLPWEEAVKQVPSLDNIPMKPMVVVHRPNEIISSCEEFIRAWTGEIRNLGVEYKYGLVQKVELVQLEEPRRQGKGASNYTYKVRCHDGKDQEFDVVVLAAGVYSPLLATQLGVGEYVPTYPLRGFSLTTFVSETDTKIDKQPKTNLLPKAFSLDSMYCTSVTPQMARWAGFGEFVGYPSKDKSVPSIGPSILSRYSNILFPNAASGNNKEDALRCFRPASPDDLPIVGAIPKAPGLFVHTGHGKYCIA